ncbi:MAG: efflux transporter outer membrane subunit [Phycisphaerales bacterium]|nr:efflux transporter outer membrane subunit [Phycisphaerales bacterium]MCI0674462.1 efflux transporter outer membrane subunit [Phycisphaerales bacterium]
MTNHLHDPSLLSDYTSNITSSSMTLVAVAMVGLLLHGCTVGPDYSAPKTDVPQSWGELSPSAPTNPDGGLITPTASAESVAQWWTTLQDPTLNLLVERAIAGNLDLRLAQARVREARAQRGIISADLVPTVDTFASYSRSRFSENSFTSAAAPGSEDDLFQAGFDALWELDVFGGTRRNLEAADADIAATIEDRRAVLVTLLAEVARNYTELRSFQRQTAIARANLKTQTDTLDLTRTRFEAGLSSDLDVARAEAQVRTTASQIPAFESAVRQSIHLLSVLTGRKPTALVDEFLVASPIPSVPLQIPIGLPSDLLRRRPDIRRAERHLAAATAQIGVATADLFPRFSLTGSLGLQSSELSNLTDSSSRFWSIGPSVNWPILDFGRIRSNIAVQDARQEQAFVLYEQTVLTSLREVEDALVAFLNEQLRRQSLSGAVASNQRAVNLATRLYEQGLTDFLSVLQAQRDLYVTEAALVQSDRDVITELVSLYKALGGGWEIEAPTDSPQPQRPPTNAARPAARTIALTQR